MNVIVFINNMFGLANDLLDVGFLWGGIALLFAYPVYFFASNLIKYTEEGRSRELLFQTILLFLIVTVIAGIWAIPEIVWLWGTLSSEPSNANEIPTWEELAWIFSSIRWGIFLIVFFLFSYLLGHEHGKNRWLVSAFGHIAVIVLGWLVNFWMGIIFISIPLIATYYGALYSLASVILPASNPDDRAEKKKRFFVLASYTWGTQSPITVVDSHAWKKYDPRIQGDITWDFAEFPIPLLNKLQRPGLVWTKSHQVAAISGGMKFKRVDGPGVAFPGKLERLDQVFDLRMQLRTRKIDVISKDGIRFIARYFTGFRIDNENWTKETYDKLRPLNPHLRGADKLSHTEGSFPFSHLRVQATLGMTSTKTTSETKEEKIVYWDQWAMNVIEDQTRKVISQKYLDELWRPANDYKFANALDIIADEIKKNSELTLRAAGMLLVVARVVDFQFPTKNESEASNEGSKNNNKDGEKENEGEKDKEGEKKKKEIDAISKQQIATWGSEWARRRANILAEAQAESERAQQEARAYAESLLLNSIAEGLQKTHEINPNLPHFVIAMRFLSALQDYIHKQPEEGEEGEETRKRMAALQEEFLLWQQRYHPEEE